MLRRCALLRGELYVVFIVEERQVASLQTLDDLSQVTELFGGIGRGKDVIV